MTNCKTPVRLLNPNALIPPVVNPYLDPTKGKWYINGEQIEVVSESGRAGVDAASQTSLIGEVTTQWITGFSKIIQLEFKVMNEGVTKQIYVDLLMNKYSGSYTLEKDVIGVGRLYYENMGLAPWMRNTWNTVEAKIDRDGNITEPAHILINLGFVELSNDEWEKV